MFALVGGPGHRRRSVASVVTAGPPDLREVEKEEPKRRQ